MLDFTKHVLKLDTGTGLHILILLCTDFSLRHKDCYEKLCTRTFLMFLSPGQPYGGSKIAKMSTVGQAICKKASTPPTGTQLIFVGCQGPAYS